MGPAAAGQYALVVSNALGAVTSAPATLSVSAPVLRFDTAPGATWLGPDGLHLRLLGLSGAGPVVLYATTDFVNWEAVQTNRPASDTLELVDAQATNHSRRFYRAVELIQPPSLATRFDQAHVLNTSTGRVFRARLTGLSGSGPVIVFGSTNLLDWEVAHTNAPLPGEWWFEVLLPDGASARWYRASEQR